MTDRCAVPRCRSEADLIYLGHGICSTHWDRLTADDQPAEALVRALGIPAADAATTEDAMSENGTENVTTTETKATTARRPKKGAKSATAATKTKAVKAPKPAKTALKRERKAKEEGLMVFAFRLSKPESEALHAAAGPANASRTMRALAAAFAAEDRAAFESIIEAARKLR